MLPKVIRIKPLHGFKLEVTFHDGTAGILDFKVVFGFNGVYKKLASPDLFQQVRISRNWHTLVWPGGIDIDPVVLYSKVTGKTVEDILLMKDASVPARRKLNSKSVYTGNINS